MAPQTSPERTGETSGTPDDALVETAAEWLHSWAGDQVGHPWERVGATRKLIFRARARGVLNILRHGHPGNAPDGDPNAAGVDRDRELESIAVALWFLHTPNAAARPESLDRALDGLIDRVRALKATR